MSKEKVPITITKSPDFRLMYSNGVFGGLTPLEGRIIFYVDRIVPTVAEDRPGGLKTGSIERELQVEVHMSPQEFISISAWMESHIESLKKQGVIVRKERKGKI